MRMHALHFKQSALRGLLLFLAANSCARRHPALCGTVLPARPVPHGAPPDAAAARRLHDSEGKHKLSLPEFRDLNTFLTSTQAAFRRADSPDARTLGTAEVGQALSQGGALLCPPPLLPCQQQQHRKVHVSLSSRFGARLWQHIATCSSA